MAEYDGTLYIATSDAVFASTDAGDTWKGLGHRPKGHAIGLVIVNETKGSSFQRTSYNVSCPAG